MAGPFTKTAAQVFAGTDAAGNPRMPIPHDAAVWGSEVERMFALFQAGGGVIFSSKADADNNLDYPNNTMAWVINDSTAANNGIYDKRGSSGTGEWVRVGDLPYSFIRAENAGAGTPNAIQATSIMPIPEEDGGALISLPIAADNTADAPTVSFNGGPALTITDAAGNPVSAGGLSGGMLINGYKVGNTFGADMGPRGWSPLLRAAEDGERRVLEVYDWTGGHGAKPNETGYLAASGLTQDISQALNFRGPQGASGDGTGDMIRADYDPDSVQMPIGSYGTAKVFHLESRDEAATVDLSSFSEAIVNRWDGSSSFSPAHYKKVDAEPSLHEGKFSDSAGNWFEITAPEGKLNVLQFGAIPDWQDASNPGTDSTDMFNAALVCANATGIREVVAPAGHYGVAVDESDDDAPAIRLQSYVTLRLDNAHIHLRTNTVQTRYFTIFGRNVTKAAVVGTGVVYGDRDTHVITDPNSQAGMALGGYDLTGFYCGGDLTFRDTIGDGMYFGRCDINGGNSFVVNNPKFTNNRRNSMSFIHVNGGVVNNPDSWDTNSEIFQYAYDIEPNNPDECIKDLVINNPRSKNSPDGILAVMLQNYDDTAEPMSITINGLFSEGDGALVSGADRGAVRFVGPHNSGTTPGGYIKINDPVIKNADRHMFNWMAWHADGPHAFVNRPKGFNVGIDSHGSGGVTGFAFYASPSASYDTGGFTITEPYIEQGNRNFRFEAGTGRKLRNLKIINPVRMEMSGLNALNIISDGDNENLVVMDQARSMVFETNSGENLRSSLIAPHVVYSGDSGNSTINLQDTVAVGLETTIEYWGNNELTLASQSAIYPMESTSMATSTYGSNIRLRRLATGWLVLSRQGTWTSP